MDTSSANPLPVPQALPAWHVTIATIAPLVVVVYATRSVMAIDERHGMGAVAYWSDGAWRCSGLPPGSTASCSIAGDHFIPSWLP